MILKECNKTGIFSAAWLETGLLCQTWCDSAGLKLNWLDTQLTWKDVATEHFSERAEPLLSLLKKKPEPVWTCGCLTCTSIPVEVPSRALCVDGLYGDVVWGVGDQILQSGVVSVSWNHSLRNRNTKELEISRHQGVSDVIQKRKEKMVCRSLVCLGVPCHLLLLIEMGLGCYFHCFGASVDS